jgi:hypothetical protein
MAKAKFRKVYGKVGSGRFVVSEGIAPSEYLLPHEALPTLYFDEEDNRFEVVMTKGTIVSGVQIASDDTRLVPANGTGGAQAWGDADTVDFGDGATPTNVAGDEDTVSVPANSTPLGCLQYDVYRPFDKGTSQGAGWITHGYVEWPMVQGLNGDVRVGDFVRADHMGRAVRAGTPGTNSHLNVAKVVAVEYFNTNYDDGLLSYMQLPSDPGALQHVYELTKSGPYAGKLGIRANLDVDNAVGAFRAYLIL